MSAAEELVWREPPPRRSAGRPMGDRWPAIAQALRGNPGASVLLAENVSTGVASSARKCLRRQGPGFEVTTRGVEGKKGRADVYVRWVPPTLTVAADPVPSIEPDVDEDSPAPHMKCEHCGRTFGTSDRCAAHELRCSTDRRAS